MNKKGKFKLEVFFIMALALIFIGGIYYFSYGKEYIINKKDGLKKQDIYFISHYKDEKTIEELTKYKKSVVLIKTDEEKVGSGIIIGDEGYILTNYHVIKDSVGCSVFFQGTDNSMGKEADITLIGFDEEKDLALLKLNTNSKENGYIPIGNSDNVVEGEKVITISSPQGIINTISDGIISSIRKEENAKYIQTTAPVSEGSSGGALSNMKGELIGIITFKAPSGENLNFALSSNDIRDFLNGSMRNNKSDNSYIFPYSHKIQLTSEDLKELDLWNLSLARNEIYARHGYVFKDQKIKKYFEGKKWYSPNKHFSEKDFNKIEKNNISFILLFEEMLQ